MIYNLSTPYQDLISLYVKAEMVHDILTFNTTDQIGAEYQEWLYKHRDLIDELLTMLAKDLDDRTGPKKHEKISYLAFRRAFNK